MAAHLEICVMAWKKSAERLKLWICRKTGVVPPGPAYFVWLCRHGSPREILRAARNGADANAMFGGSISGLMYAVANRRGADVVDAVLEAGCDPNLRGAEGETALMVACARGAGADVVRALLDGGADPQMEAHGGMKAADFARDAKNAGALEALEEFQKKT